MAAPPSTVDAASRDFTMSGPDGSDPGAVAGRATLVVHVAVRATTPWRLRPRSGGDDPDRPASGAPRLEVDDLRGHRLAVVDAARAHNRFDLPAGTCVVTTIDAGRRRSYTLTLESGASFDLHVRPGAR
jgi:hypothetical protein